MAGGKGRKKMNAKEKIQHAYRSMKGFSQCLDCPAGASSTKQDVQRLLELLTVVEVRPEDVIQLVRNDSISAEHPNAFSLDSEHRFGFGTCIAAMDVFVAIALCVLQGETPNLTRPIFTAEGIVGLKLWYVEKGDHRTAHVLIRRQYGQGNVPLKRDVKFLRTLGATLAKMSPIPVSVEIRIDNMEFGER
jgi:hypothetical protein